MVDRRKIVHLLKIVLAGKRYFQNAQERLALARHVQKREVYFNKITYPF